MHRENKEKFLQYIEINRAYGLVTAKRIQLFKILYNRQNPQDDGIICRTLNK